MRRAPLSLLLPLLFLLGIITASVAGAFTMLRLPMPLAASLEELLKVLVLYAFFRLDSTLITGFRSAVSGLSLGIGFGIAELLNYLVFNFYHGLSFFSVRAPPLLMHVITATLLGYSLYLGRKNKLWLLAGFASAVGIHLAFNYSV